MLYQCFLIIVQVVLESLPISSTGHVILLERLCMLVTPSQAASFFEMQEIVCSDDLLHVFHVPTLLVIMIFFRDRWVPCLFSLHRMAKRIVKLIGFALCADMMTALFFLVKNVVGVSMPLSYGFLITMILLLSLYWCPQGSRRGLTIFTALLLGVVQGAALFPGISRLASVFVAARWMGFTGIRAFEIAWVLQIPLIIGGAGLGLVHMRDNLGVVLDLIFAMKFSLLIAMVIAYAGMYVVWRLASINKVWVFGIYMIVPLVLSLLV